MKKEIVLKPIFHKGKKQIALYFPPDTELQQPAKNMGCAWSSSNKCWHIYNTPDNLREIYRIFKGKAFIDSNALFQKPERPLPVFKATPAALPELSDEEKRYKLLKFKYWMRSRRYSENTIDVYMDALKIFFRYFHDKPLHKITNDDIILFNNQYIIARKFSSAYQSQIINAIKRFYGTIQNKALMTDKIERPKKEKKLPNVLSREEVKEIIKTPVNIKHRAMLCLIYSCGLRCGELLSLKPVHVDSKRNILIIKEAKGKKDRIVPLSPKIIELLREYFRIYRPQQYLFEGAVPGQQYTQRSLQNVLKQSISRAKIKKPVTLHWLRHSYATHLLENGTDLRYIQEILGHKSSRTTEIYTHVSTKNIQQIKSPFDYL